MEWQLNALSNIALLVALRRDAYRFALFHVYPRHEYFRRMLCNLLGRDVEYGELPTMMR